MNSYCKKINTAHFISYKNISQYYKSYERYIDKLLTIFNNSIKQTKNLIIVNIPLNESPVTHKAVNTILTYATSPEQFAYQLSHELVHIYLSNSLPIKLIWIEELLASSMSFYMASKLDNNYKDYLSKYIYPYKCLLTNKLEVQEFISINYNVLLNQPDFIYNQGISVAYLFKDLNLLDIIGDILLCNQLNDLSTLNDFLAELHKHSTNSDTLSFIEFLSI